MPRLESRQEIAGGIVYLKVLAEDSPRLHLFQRDKKRIFRFHALRAGHPGRRELREGESLLSFVWGSRFRQRLRLTILNPGGEQRVHRQPAGWFGRERQDLCNILMSVWAPNS